MWWLAFAVMLVPTVFTATMRRTSAAPWAWRRSAAFASELGLAVILGPRATTR